MASDVVEPTALTAGEKVQITAFSDPVVGVRHRYAGSKRTASRSVGLVHPDAPLRKRRRLSETALAHRVRAQSPRNDIEGQALTASKPRCTTTPAATQGLSGQKPLPEFGSVTVLGRIPSFLDLITSRRVTPQSSAEKDRVANNANSSSPHAPESKPALFHFASVTTAPPKSPLTEAKATPVAPSQQRPVDVQKASTTAGPRKTLAQLLLSGAAVFRKPSAPRTTLAQATQTRPPEWDFAKSTGLPSTSGAPSQKQREVTIEPPFRLSAAFIPLREQARSAVNAIANTLFGTAAPWRVSANAAPGETPTATWVPKDCALRSTERDDDVQEDLVQAQKESAVAALLALASAKAALPQAPAQRMIITQPKTHALRKTIRYVKQRPKPEDVAQELLVCHSLPFEDGVALREIPRASPSLSGEAFNVFTDGSFLGRRFGGCGVAFKTNGNWSGRAVALGVIYGSNEAEMAGVYEAMQMAEGLLARVGARQLVIYTDSKAALGWIADRKVHGNRKELRLVKPVLTQRAHLARLGIDVQLRWVKGHSTSAGNAVADVLAHFGAKQSCQGERNRRWDNPHAQELSMNYASRNAVDVAVERQNEMKAVYDRRTLFPRAMIRNDLWPDATGIAQRKHEKSVKRLDIVRKTVLHQEQGSEKQKLAIEQVPQQTELRRLNEEPDGDFEPASKEIQALDDSGVRLRRSARLAQLSRPATPRMPPKTHPWRETLLQSAGLAGKATASLSSASVVIVAGSGTAMDPLVLDD